MRQGITRPNDFAGSWDLPSDVQKLCRRFERWRSSHTGRLPIPEPLWAAAADLARRHGVFRIAKALHLEYGKPKELAGAVGPVTKKPAAKTLAAFPRTKGGQKRTAVLSHTQSRPRPPVFVELFAPSSGSPLMWFRSGWALGTGCGLDRGRGGPRRHGE